MTDTNTSQNTAQNFADSLLGLLSYQTINGIKLGDLQTSGNESFVLKWIARENTKAQNNPLATSQPEPGDSPFNYDKSGKPLVRNYSSLGTGLDATQKTLSNGKYNDILRALATGNADQIDQSGGLSQGLLEWSGGAYSTLRDTKPTSGTTVLPGKGPDAGQAQPDNPFGFATAWVNDLTKWISSWIKPALKMGLGLLLLILGMYILVHSQIPSVTPAAEAEAE